MPWKQIAWVAAAVVISGGPVHGAQTVEQIVAKHVAATGGDAQWAKVDTLTVRSRSEMFSFDALWKAPNKIRLDVWSDATPDTDTRAFDGTSGWRLNSAEGSLTPRSMSDQEIALLREEVDWMWELINHKSKGIKVSLVRTEPVSGRSAHRLEVVRPSSATVHVFIDAASGLEVQRTKWATAPDGEQAELVLPVGDHRVVGGLMLPHRVGPATRSYEVNAVVADSRFQRPGPQSEREFAASKMAEASGKLLPIGSLAPAWTLKDAQGRSHRSSDFAGKIVILDFWATWCVPCHRMMPELQRLHDEFSDQGVSVIGVSTSEHGGDPAQLMKDRGYTYQLLVNGESLAEAYRIVGMPVLYVIGRDGRIIHADVGAEDGAAAARRSVIAAHVRRTP